MRYLKFLHTIIKKTIKFIRMNLSLFIPVAIFVYIEQYMDTSTYFTLKESSPYLLVMDIFSNIDNSVIMVLGFIFVAKILFLTISSLDIIFSDMHKKKYTEIMKSLAPYFASYTFFSIVWYLIFFMIGFSFLFIVNFLGLSNTIQYSILGLVFLILFPVFYSGLSIFILAYMLIKSSSMPISIILERAKGIYVFYSLRSMADLIVMSLIFYLLSRINNDYFFIKILLSIFLVSIFTVFIRVASFQYKVYIFNEFYIEYKAKKIDGELGKQNDFNTRAR